MVQHVGGLGVRNCYRDRTFLGCCGIKCVVINSNFVKHAVDKGDTVAEVVIFVNHINRVMEVSCDGGPAH